MSQRAIVLQVCCVCNKRFINKAALEDHTSSYHGVNWHPSVLKRTEDETNTREFYGMKPKQAPGAHSIPWPVAFGE